MFNRRDKEGGWPTSRAPGQPSELPAEEIVVVPRDQIFGLAQTNPDFDEFENKLITLAQYSIIWRPTTKATTFLWK